ncbi:MAG: hypothetical protein MUF87_19340 [Anaerolineae bacterium]|nr:hypothetical protein [Anaerolineae bacterium]
MNIDPNYEEAQHDLATMDAAKAAPRPNASGPTASPMIAIPKGIPGAPESYRLSDFVHFIEEVARDSLELLTLKSPAPMLPASWWNNLLLILTTGAIIALGNLIRVLFSALRGGSLNLIAIISNPILILLYALIGVGAGCALSYWYITTQRGGQASFLDHSYTLIRVWAPLSVILVVIGLLELFFAGAINTLKLFLLGFTFGSPILTLMAAAVAGYALYLMMQGLQKLYPALPRSQWAITGAIFLVVVALLF